MEYRKILLILAITILSLTACKKEENPASVENTTIEETTIEETATDSKTDDNMDTVTNADRGAAVGEVVDNTTSGSMGSGEMTDELAADLEKYKDATSSDDYELTEEDKQRIEEALKRQEQNADSDVRQEVEDAVKDGPDPTLSQETLDYLDQMFDSKGSDEEIITYGDMTDPNTEGGLRYHGGTESW